MRPVTVSRVWRAILIVSASCFSTTALDLGVDRGDERVAGLALDLAVVAEHATHGVDRHPPVAGHAAQPGVVLLLDAGAADRRGAVDRAVAVRLGLVELVLGDRAEVAEHVGEVDAVRRG